jgi:membrane protein implicated in regulation of membrane protease activity
MYILAIGWLYVVLMASLVEATAVNGSIPGAIVTFVCYGLMPVGLLLYILGRPARRQRREQQQAQAAPGQDSVAPDAGSHAAGAAEAGSIAPVRKED